MFTGIVEAVGDVVSLTPGGETTRIAVRSALAREVRLGESVAVNGCCLTIVEPNASELRFDAIRETLEKTALGDLTAGARVNLGYFIVRYDYGRGTDFQHPTGSSHHFVTLGADF